MRGRLPVSTLLAVFWLGQTLNPCCIVAGAAVVAPVRVSAPVSPVAGPAALGSGLATPFETRLSPLSAPLSAPLLVAPIAPAVLDRSLDPPRPEPASPLAAELQAPLPLAPAEQQTPAAEPEAALLSQVAALTAAPGRFEAPTTRARQGILSVLRTLFYQSSADAARAKEVSEGIDPGWVEQMERQDKGLPAPAKRKRTAVQKKGFTEAALNKELLAAHRDTYTDELPMGRITDQKGSGRCWIFASLNMIRSLLMSEGKVTKGFEFSQNYLHFFNMLEKANRQFEKVSDMVVSRAGGKKISGRSFREKANMDEALVDGGDFEYFQFLVAKYGLVPKSAMKETKSSNATDTLNHELSLTMAAAVEELMSATHGLKAKAAAKQAQEVKKVALLRVWKILATHLGTPPESFSYQRRGGKRESFTPKSFARKFAAFDPDDYVVIGSLPGVETGHVYQVKRSAIGAARPGERSYDTRFMNLGAERLEQLALASLQAGQPVYFSADTRKDMDDDTGIMHPDVYSRTRAYGLSKREAQAKASRRLANFLNVGGGNHVMLMTGFDRPDKKAPVLKYKVENSWGRGAGDRGVYHMYRDWLRENVDEIVVHKKFLAPAERKAWAGKAKPINEKDVY